MYTGFCHICRIDQESKGLRMTFEEAPAGFLHNDHAEFKRVRDYLLHLLHETQKGDAPRPTWVAMDGDGVITDVRLVLSGIPMSARRDSSGAYLIVFPFTNMSTKLSPDHPRFREFERYLLQALKHETPLTYVAAAEDFYTIDDMIPPPASGRPLQDGVVEDVADGRVVTNVANDVPT